MTSKSVSISTDKIHNPHDSLFRAMTGNVEITIDLLKSSLPAKLFSQIDLSTLKIANKSFMSSALKSKHSDMIYEAKINGKAGYIAFVIEHQSTSHPLMAFKAL